MGDSSYWHGWAGIKHLVAFGDSLSATHFNVNGEQPSEINPLGNPKFPGITTANGPNWLSFLTTTCNATFLKTINLSFGGATVDADIVSPWTSGIRSFKDQITKQWVPKYVPPPPHFDWGPHDTLFATFLGNNDVRNTYLRSDTSSLEYDVYQYVALLHELYHSGGRNFLVLNVPPFERSPMMRAQDSEAIRQMGDLTQRYNSNLTQAISKFSNTHPDATVFIFDTHDLFNRLLDDPCTYEETCPLQVTTSYCEAYRLERQDQYRFDAKCGYSADKYFWLGTVHPSFRVHNVMAKAIAAYLSHVT